MEPGERLLTQGNADGRSRRSDPITRRTLHAELLASLRQMIYDGELPAGSKIREKELCARFDVSRTPMREAFKVLANEGLVQLSANRGAVVAALTLQDLEDAFPIMGALEALAGELACIHITDAEIAEIRGLHERMTGCYGRRELASYFQLNQEIHARIRRASHSKTLMGIAQSLGDRLQRARYMANISTTRWAEALAEHVDILTALETRDGKRLGALLKTHLDHKLETVRQVLRQPHP
jgi:DNA-binding GntR family transcriptional regulator